MEINVRDYIRTNEGNIGIVLSFYCRNEEANIWRIRIKYKNGDEEEICSHLQVKKYSKDIIDLIEVGDYVNGNKIIRIDEKCALYPKTLKALFNSQGDMFDIFEKDIKSILTHEQFEANTYTIEKES